jgi:hypothetical protein
MVNKSLTSYSTGLVGIDRTPSAVSRTPTQALVLHNKRDQTRTHDVAFAGLHRRLPGLGQTFICVYDPHGQTPAKTITVRPRTLASRVGWRRP